MKFIEMLVLALLPLCGCLANPSAGNGSMLAHNPAIYPNIEIREDDANAKRLWGDQLKTDGLISRKTAHHYIEYSWQEKGVEDHEWIISTKSLCKTYGPCLVTALRKEVCRGPSESTGAVWAESVLMHFLTSFSRRTRRQRKYRSSCLLTCAER